MSSARGDVSVYDRLVWPEGAVEKLLSTGERRRELIAYFGEAEYARLQPMAVAAAAATQDADRCVYVVPGLMGSQLCLRRAPPAPDDLLWPDPTDISHGQLSLLTMPGAPVMASGPVLYGYLPLKLALMAAGYTVRCFAYDWRRDIAESGAVLARQLATEPARELSVIAHSMGGLVARIALRSNAGLRMRRLITLGTPRSTACTTPKHWRAKYSPASTASTRCCPSTTHPISSTRATGPGQARNPMPRCWIASPCCDWAGLIRASAPSLASATKRP